MSPVTRALELDINEGGFSLFVCNNSSLSIYFMFKQTSIMTIIVDDGLTVIWAKKSIVYLPSLQNKSSSTDGVYAGKQGLRLRQRQVTYDDILAPRISDPEHGLSCPWNELEKLTLRLQTNTASPRPRPELIRRFEQFGFSRLIDVKVERLGRCSGQPKPFVQGKLSSVSFRDGMHWPQTQNLNMFLSLIKEKFAEV